LRYGRQRVVWAKCRQKWGKDVGKRRSWRGDVEVLQAASGQGRRCCLCCLGPMSQIARDWNELVAGRRQDQTPARPGEQADPQASLEEAELA
jgi:hypothetical protein